MEQVYKLILNKYSKLVILFFLLIIGFFVFSAKNFQLDASSDSLILEQDEDLKKYREVIDDYGSTDFLIVTFTDQDKVLTDNNLNRLKLFITNIKQLTWVDSVQSIFDVPLLEVNDQKLTDLVNEILTIDSPTVDLSEAEFELVNSPIFKNLIISEDSSTTGIIINFIKIKLDYMDNNYIIIIN